MHFTYNERTITYEVQGKGAQTLILVPALGTTGEIWRENIPAFLDDFTVVTYNPAGHDAQGGEAPTLDDLATELHILAHEVHARRPHIVGLSLGGMIAQEYGIKYPEDVQSLVLVSTTSSYPPERRDQLVQRAQEAEQQGMQAIAQGSPERWFTAQFRQRHPQTVQWVVQMVAGADPSAYAAAARVAAAVNTTDRLNRIGAPVLVIRGADDPGITEDMVTTLVDHISNARSRTIEQASHLCNVERPDVFNALVHGFLQAIIQESPGQPGVPGLPKHGSEAPAPGPSYPR